MNLNRATLIGRVGAQPELKSTTSGVNIATFSLATNHVYKNKNGEKIETTQWHNIVAFGKVAEVLNQYVIKGQILLVEGRIEYQSWDKKDGGKGYKTEIILESFGFGPKPGNSTQSRPAASQPEQAPEPQPPADGEVIDVEQIPF